MNGRMNTDYFSLFVLNEQVGFVPGLGVLVCNGQNQLCVSVPSSCCCGSFFNLENKVKKNNKKTFNEYSPFSEEFSLAALTGV